MGVPDLTKFEDGIAKTGFALEFKVSEAFRRAGWSVINNKYYVDDVVGSVREIDLIAYKVSKIEEIRIYSAVVVSCKKNDKNAWALVAKKLHRTDPNKNWYPLHNWSNHPILDFSLRKRPWSSDYIKDAATHEFFGKLIEPQNDIFAFQELNKVSGAPKDDTSIFQAINSLMKAQGYEIETRNKQPKTSILRKDKSFYNFTLLSVVDSDLLRIFMSDDSDGENLLMNSEEVSAEKYIGSYIINEREVTARINFIRAESIDEYIDALDDLHDFNVSFCQHKIDEYYDKPFVDRETSDVLISLFRARVSWSINRLLERSSLSFESKSLTLWWRESVKTLEIELPFNTKIIDHLNRDDELQKKVGTALEDVYRYKGPFVFGMGFDDEIPF